MKKKTMKKKTLMMTFENFGKKYSLGTKYEAGSSIEDLPEEEEEAIFLDFEESMLGQGSEAFKIYAIGDDIYICYDHTIIDVDDKCVFDSSEERSQHVAAYERAKDLLNKYI